MTHRAVFLDRDGTLVEPRHYPTHPRELRLFDGLAPDLQALQAAGFRLVVITNQSGIARGIFTEAQLAVMHEHLRNQLGLLGVRLDSIYYCPHHPEGTVAPFASACDCRKPEPGMLVRAASQLNISLERSWFVGDILDDVEAGHRAGCRTILVDLGTEPAPIVPARTPSYVARSTRHALRLIRSIELRDVPADTGYLPTSWQRRKGESQTRRGVQLNAPTRPGGDHGILG